MKPIGLSVQKYLHIRDEVEREVSGWHEKWRPLIDAAGKVDKDELEFILGILDDQSYYADKGKTVIALLKALPD